MENEEVVEQELRGGMRWIWFLGGCALSITTLCALVLLVLLLGSAAVNAYLGWTLSGYKISISIPTPIPAGVGATPTSGLAMVPTATPTVEPTGTPTTVPAQATLEAEFATLAAIATRVAESEQAINPSGTPMVIAPNTPQAAGGLTPAATPGPASALGSSEAVAEPGASGRPAATSTNSYSLIPIEGKRESRPAAEHADLNLKLREPQPAEYDRSLVEIPGSGIDPDAPKLSSVFKPDFVNTYAVHDWDWGCNCKGDLILDGSAVLVGIKTSPGEPIFIPKTERDIYEGKYYAVVLYASPDSLTFLYARAGSVVSGYTVHYLGLQTDPNLVALFEASEGSELPGLTLDTPVGVATEELIVAIRDNGTFLDARSKRDWWD
jgi:hypothetical protein